MAKKIKYRSKRNWNLALVEEPKPKKRKKLEIPAGTPPYLVVSMYANNKKHVIKGVPDRIKKRMKKMCGHNWYNPTKPNKPGKVMLRRDPEDPGMVYCKLCGRRFPVDPFDPQQVKDAVEIVRSAADHVAFFDGRKAPEKLGETAEYISNLRIEISKMPKLYKRTVETNSAMAVGDKKKKRKGKKKRSGGYSSHGEWRLN